MTYTDGHLVATPASGGGAVSLKSASVLQANGMIGIEQVGAALSPSADAEGGN